MIVNLKSPTNLSGFYLIYKGSTNLEKEGNRGISHLMEHLVYKSLDKYQNEMDTLGINQNAFTSSNEIVFYMTGLERSLSKWRDRYIEEISKFLENITEEDFEKERKIVIQEYMDAFTDQNENHWLNLDRKLLANYNPIGAKEDLENLTWQDCLDFYELQYKHPSMIINVSNSVEFTSGMKFNTPTNTKIYKPNTDIVVIERDTNYNTNVSLMMVNNKPLDLECKDYDKISFVNHMLSGGLQSPLYQEVREKRGLVYGIGAHLSRLGNQGVNQIYTSAIADNIEEITDIIDTVLINPDKYLTKERFNVVKEQLAIIAETRDINRYDYVKATYEPKGWSLMEIAESMTYDDVMNIADVYFNPMDFYISRDDTEFLKYK